jgi:hypothetical protein
MRGYWETVAANHVARARSYSLANTFKAAGIDYYRIEAVLDDRTTPQCEFLHGKVLPVGPAADRINRVLASPQPEAVLTEQPFIRDRGDRLTIGAPGEEEQTVARIDERPTGGTPEPAASGRYTPVMSPGDMVDAAIGLPPYHFRCRSTAVPA